MAASAGPITLAWEVDPTLLTDTVASELNVDINDDAKLVVTCATVLRGVTPAGVAGTKRFKYAWLLLLAAAAAVADSTDAALRGLCPVRGTFELAWLQTLFRALDTAGLFSKAPSCIEELILKVQSHLRDTMSPIRSPLLQPDVWVMNRLIAAYQTEDI